MRRRAEVLRILLLQVDLSYMQSVAYNNIAPKQENFMPAKPDCISVNSLLDKGSFNDNKMNIDNYTDEEIVKAILNRDALITKEYLYRKCYPLFKAIYDKYYTDCETPIELINEIYVYICVPQPKTRKSKLENFGFRCTLTMWLKIVTENYCHQIFAKRVPMDQNFDGESDSFDHIADSIEIEISTLRMEDDQKTIQRVLNQMPNARYRQLIELRYLQEKTNEETAAALNMKIDSYYSKHKLAKAQLYTALKKEGII